MGDKNGESCSGLEDIKDETCVSFDETNWTVTDEDGDPDSSSSEYEDNDEATDLPVQEILERMSLKVKKYAKRKIKKLSYSHPPPVNPLLNFENLYGEESEDIYSTKYSGKSLMIVIQNKEFDESETRLGSTADAKNIKKTFRKLGFIVKVFKNLTGEKIDIKLRKAQQKFNHKDASCFACVILSHGKGYYAENYQRKDFILGCDENPIALEYIMNIFNNSNCPDLFGKPRLFFIQACRGILADDGVYTVMHVPNPVKKHIIKPVEGSKKTVIDASPGVEDEEPKFDFNLVLHPSPCYTDSVVMFASPPGYASYSRKGGSIFISCLCDEFQKYCKKKTFYQILTMVSCQMAFDYETANVKPEKYNNKKIVPCICSRLTKDIKFDI